ncbi:MAG: RHS repeat-associated core domain-containing protein [Bryobacteraceae bacterium]
MSGLAGITNYTHNAADELISAGATTLTYDGNGNLQSKTTGANIITHAWDALNRLTSVTGPGINTQYAYDGDGNRVSQTVSAGAYQYLNDTVTALPVVLDETGPDGPITYAYGLSMVSARGNGFEHYYQFDGLGSTVSLTNQLGALRANYLYDPWGRLLNPVDPLGGRNKYKFTGEVSDGGTALAYLRARYYDPALGRFLIPDPLGYKLSAPQSANKYVYALNAPTTYVDRLGQEATPPSVTTYQPDVGAVLGATALGGENLWRLPSLNSNAQSTPASILLQPRADQGDGPKCVQEVGKLIPGVDFIILGLENVQTPAKIARGTLSLDEAWGILTDAGSTLIGEKVKVVGRILWGWGALGALDACRHSGGPR